VVIFDEEILVYTFTKLNPFVLYPLKRARLTSSYAQHLGEEGPGVFPPQLEASELDRIKAYQFPNLRASIPMLQFSRPSNELFKIELRSKISSLAALE
jgi:hypothetical protein